VWEKIGSTISHHNVLFGRRVVSIDVVKKTVMLDNGQPIVYKSCISTLPLDQVLLVLD
jgi:hypothetical protein